MKPAIIYSRFSPRPGADQSESIETQQERCRAYCTLRGYAIKSEHADRAMSGARADNRPGLQQALAAACQCKGILVVYSLSRLARSTKDAIEIATRLDKCGAELASLHENIDTSTPGGRLFYTLMSAFNQFEREVISERTSDSMLRHQASGRRMGRKDRLPYGKMLDPQDPDRLVDNPQEQAMIEHIRSMYALSLSVRAVQTRLNASYRPDSLTCRGGPWNYSLVSKIVKG